MARCGLVGPSGTIQDRKVKRRSMLRLYVGHCSRFANLSETIMCVRCSSLYVGIVHGPQILSDICACLVARIGSIPPFRKCVKGWGTHGMGRNRKMKIEEGRPSAS